MRATAYVRTKVEVETAFRVWLRTRDRSRNTGTELFVGSVTVPGLQRGDWYAATTGTAWSDTEADAATPGANVVGDAVTLYNNSSGYSETRSWSGSAWTAVDQRLDGNLLVTESVTSPAINATTLNALIARVQDYLQISAATGFTAGGPTYTDDDSNIWRAYMDRNEIRIQQYISGTWVDVIRLNGSNGRIEMLRGQDSSKSFRILTGISDGLVRMYLYGSGGHLVVNRSIQPDRNSQHTLGTLTHAWRDLYVTDVTARDVIVNRRIKANEIQSAAPLKLNRGVRPTAIMHTGSRRTEDQVFDFLSPALPATNDMVMVSGGIKTPATVTVAGHISYAKRTSSTRISLYGIWHITGPFSSNNVGAYDAHADNGSSNRLFDVASMSW